MKKFIKPVIIITLIIVGAKFLFFKGNSHAGGPGQMPPPVIEVTKVMEIEVPNKIESTGRVEAVDSVDIVARIEGFLQKSYFKEGSFVKKGDLLFLIEPDRYQISVQQASQDVMESKAALIEAEKSYARIKELVDKDYASRSQLDNVVAQKDRMNAVLGVKQANLRQAKLNYSYTRVLAPVSGKIGRINIDEGNVVSPASGPMARIVSMNPIYVNFNINSADYLKLIKDKKTAKTQEAEIKFSDNTTYPAKGKIVFFDNEVNSATGTVDVRAEFTNPDSLLVPGQYVDVVMTVDKPEKTLAVPEEALLDSAQGKYVYVLQQDNTVKIRPVTTKMQYKGYWTITTGLTAGELVVSNGVQKLRPDIKVMRKDKMPAPQAKK